MTEPDDGATEAVRCRLSAAGIAVSDDDLAAATDIYRFLQSGVQLLYRAPNVRYADPALVFRADPPLTDWGG